MSTALDIDGELHRQAKAPAAGEEIPLREVIEDSLRLYLSNRPRKRGYRLNRPVQRGRTRPGVRIDDRESLYEILEGRK